MFLIPFRKRYNQKIYLLEKGITKNIPFRKRYKDIFIYLIYCSYDI